MGIRMRVDLTNFLYCFLLSLIPINFLSIILYHNTLIMLRNRRKLTTVATTIGPLYIHLYSDKAMSQQPVLFKFARTMTHGTTNRTGTPHPVRVKRQRYFLSEKNATNIRLCRYKASTKIQ